MAISARIDELKKKFDENPRRYFAPLANEYRKAGDPGQAIFICEAYLPQQPGHMSGHIVFGQALFELGRFEQARGVFETALSLDPENLIALRHLGDISRQMNDPDAARRWYERVLEADPRNEEIAQIVASLAPAAPRPAPAAPPTDAETEALFGSPSPTPLPVTTTVPAMPPRGETPPHLDALPPPASRATPAFLSDEPVRAAMDAPAGPQAEFQPLELEPAQPATPATPETSAQLFDLEDVSFSGVSFQPAAEEEPESTEADDVPIDKQVELLGGSTEFELEEEGFQADPLAIAATPAIEETQEPPPLPEPTFEAMFGPPPVEREFALEPPAPTAAELPTIETPAIDLSALEEREPEPAADLGPPPAALPSVEDIAALEFAQPEAEPFAEALPVAAEATAPVDEPQVEPDQVVVEEPVAAETAEPAVAETAEEVFAEAAAPEPAAPEPVAAESTPPELATPEPEPVSAPPEAFVTETMAELYLQQGHLESALDIYRKLVEQRPFDAEIRERLEIIERRIAGPTVEEPLPAPTPEPEPVAVAPEATPVATPTIRDFLSLLARGGQAPAGALAHPVAAGDARQTAEVAVQAVEMASGLEAVGEEEEIETVPDVEDRFAAPEPAVEEPPVALPQTAPESPEGWDYAPSGAYAAPEDYAAAEEPVAEMEAGVLEAPESPYPVAESMPEELEPVDEAEIEAVASTSAIDYSDPALIVTPPQYESIADTQYPQDEAVQTAYVESDYVAEGEDEEAQARYLATENVEAETPALVEPETTELEGVEAAPLEDETVEAEAAADEAEADYASWTREQAVADSAYAAGDDVGLVPEAYATEEALDVAEPVAEPMFDAAGFAEADALPAEPVGDSIDGLFGHAQPSEVDSAAADMFAQAFAPDNGQGSSSFFDVSASTGPAESHPAADVVAPSVEPPPVYAAPSQPLAPMEASEDDGFSFDQFFADDVQDVTPTQPREAEVAPGDAADVAQFNQWLNRLKKT